MRRSPRQWDLFCRVIDNHGDLGVCWRLAADLASRGATVRLWADDTSALAWMAPGGAPGLQVVSWTDPAPDVEPGDVVVEAFGCDPPPAFVARMASRPRPPVWVNLEYLSAEPYVERSHGLASPQANGLGKWFFYPGFSARTGGLLREPGLLAARRAFDRQGWLAARRIERQAHERVVSLFCYENPALPALLDALADAPTLLLATPGHAQRQLRSLAPRPSVRVVELPWLPQPEYDRLLWSADLNFVRGEDSLVRAVWAGSPFVWQIYPQHDGAHAPKLEALLDAFCPGVEPTLAASVRRLWRVWNGLSPGELALPPLQPWASATSAWRDQLATQDDLCTQLMRFVDGKG
jgi:uncharacterized repeat protein (TIGR03837 family)